jgi:microcystin-dependent protein
LALGTSFLVPTGVLNPYAGATAPVGWLLCFGQSISRTTYATLFTAIGTTYGSVSGTTFNLPDMRGQVTAGLDNMGGTSRNRVVDTDADVLGGEIGDSGGHTHTHNLSAGAHTLTTAEIPSHSHVLSHMQAGGTDYDGNGPRPGSGYVPSPTVLLNTNSTGGNGSHDHNMSGSITSEEALQPTIFLNYIIKT